MQNGRLPSNLLFRYPFDSLHSQFLQNFFFGHPILTHGGKNEFKAQKIAKYFSQNPKNHPFVMTLSLIYSFFNKVLIFHALPNKDKRSVASALGVSPYFAGDYIHAGTKYSLKSTTKIISIIREADAQSKGGGLTPTASSDILRPLLYKIMRT